MLVRRIKEYLKMILSDPNYGRIINKMKIKDRKPMIIIIGSPVHGNLGDHAIYLAQEALFHDNYKNMDIVDISMPMYHVLKFQIQKYILQNDLIVVAGGGWMGNLWMHNELVVREIVSTYKNNVVVIMPQTVYFDDKMPNYKQQIKLSKDVYSQHNKLIFALREKASYYFVINNEFISNRNRCLILPDVVLYMDYSLPKLKRDGILLCFRNDREKIVEENCKLEVEKVCTGLTSNVRRIDTVVDRKISKKNRVYQLYSKIDEFKSAKLVITDRLHAMLFAAVTATPCLVLDNKTKKVSGVYEWIRQLEYIVFHKSNNLIENNIKKLYNSEENDYSNQFVKDYYKELINDINVQLREVL